MEEPMQSLPNQTVVSSSITVMHQEVPHESILYAFTPLLRWIVYGDIKVHENLHVPNEHDNVEQKQTVTFANWTVV